MQCRPVHIDRAGYTRLGLGWGGDNTAPELNEHRPGYNSNHLSFL